MSKPSLHHVSTIQSNQVRKRQSVLLVLVSWLTSEISIIGRTTLTYLNQTDSNVVRTITNMVAFANVNYFACEASLIVTIPDWNNGS